MKSEEKKKDEDEVESPTVEKVPENKTAASTSKSAKKGKALKAKIAEKEAENSRPKTKEELLAEKLKNQRLQEESDLALAKEAIGGGSSGGECAELDSIELNTRADYDSFRKALSTK